MAKKQIPIFATQSDLSMLARDVFSVRPLEFASTELFDKPVIAVLSDFDHPLPFVTYVAFDKGTHVAIRMVPQRNGPNKYTVSMESMRGVAIHTGGLIDNQRLVAGQIAPVGAARESDEIYTLFGKAIRQNFEKIKSYYVGVEAIELFEKGVRLTPTAKSPELYDLAR